MKIGNAVKYDTMKKAKSNKDIFETIAGKEGISSDEARREMQQAILAARDNHDSKKRAEFKKWFGDKIPTPKEYISKSLRRTKPLPS